MSLRVRAFAVTCALVNVDLTARVYRTPTGHSYQGYLSSRSQLLDSDSGNTNRASRWISTIFFPEGLALLSMIFVIRADK